MIAVTLNSIISVMKQKGYNIFEEDDKPYNLNIVGIRSIDSNSNEFNDKLCVFYMYKGHPFTHVFDCTTDPGVYYRNNLLNAKGVAILVPGQYIGMHKLGLHQGKYEALVQKCKCKVYRDNNKDDNIDTDGAIDEGLFGINIHHQAINEKTTIGKYSAGCTVLEHIVDFETFIGLCKESVKIFKNSFTYTLLEEKDFLNGNL